MNTNRPSQKSQSSRKGKKAWRKNIDIEDLEQDLEDVREQEIVLGAGPLFEVDTKGDESNLTKAMKSEKKLKAHEILHKRSAVPALLPVHKKKEKPKTKVRKIHDLVRIAGRAGEDTSKVRLEQEGVLRATKGLDLWGSDQPAAPVRKALNPEPVIPDSKAIDLPEEGRSYNPTLDSWKDVIATENVKLEKVERQRLELEAEQARILAVMEAAKTSEEFLDDESDEEIPDEEIGQLSVGAPVKNKRKTEQQRRKARRAREQEQMRLRLKELKAQLREIETLPRNPVELPAKVEKIEKKLKTLRKAHGKYPLLEPTLAVKLSDELEDSLRRLRPEGSLAHDRFRSLQARGLIEARVPVTHKRKRALKTTEKWSYKDFNKTRSV